MEEVNLSECVAITRDGNGDIWVFGSRVLASRHPVIQSTDPIIPTEDHVTKQIPLNSLSRLLRRVSADELAEKIDDIMRDTAGQEHRIRLEKVNGHKRVMFDALLRRANKPPTDDSTIVKTILRDRILTEQENKTMNESATIQKPVAEQSVAEQSVAEKPKAKAKAKAKEPTREPVAIDTNHIKMLSNAEGVVYSKANNPKRAGSASYARFDKYVDGMSVKAAKEAGITLSDIRWDIDKGYISIV